MTKKLKWTKFDITLNILSIIVVLFGLIYIFIKLPTLPQQIPTHFENDVAVKSGSKYNLLLFGVINIVFYTFLTVAEFIQEKYSQKEHDKINRSTTHFISIMKLEIAIIISTLTIFAIYSIVLKSYVFVIYVLLIVVSLLAYSFYVLYKNSKLVKKPSVKKEDNITVK